MSGGKEMKCMQTGAEMSDERIKVYWLETSGTGRKEWEEE
tara:strand:- start:1315 stop:1434 length:120 start_codon:yes stop_codon:yes gene_type:complete